MNSTDCFSCQPLIVSGRKVPLRILHIEHVVSDLRLLGFRSFGRSDIHVPVDLKCIATDNFSLKQRRQRQGQSGFARCGGAEYDNSRNLLIPDF